MRFPSFSLQSLRSAAFAKYLIAGVRLVNGVSIVLPAFMLIGILNLSTQDFFLPAFINMSIFNGILGVLVFQLFGMYGDDLFIYRLHARKLFIAWTAAFLLILYANFSSSHAGSIPPSSWVFWFVSTYLLLLLERMILLGMFNLLASREFYLQNTVVLGCNENGAWLAQHLLQHGDIRSRFVGFIDDRSAERLPSEYGGFPVIGNTDYLVHLVHQGQVQQIVIALPWTAVERMSELAQILGRLPVGVLVAPDMQVFHYARNRATRLAGLPMLNVSESPVRGWSSTLKRVEDIVLALLALIIFSPLMLAMAILIKVKTRGPVLQHERHNGYNHALITTYVFSSLDKTETPDGEETPEHAGLEKLIRRFQLHKLPQLFNVLQGAMSMVGPELHPEGFQPDDSSPEVVAHYPARYRTKPGITGWAQVNQESEGMDALERSLALDLQYMQMRSAWLDLYILLRAMLALLSGRSR